MTAVTLAREPATLYDNLADLERPCFVVRDSQGLAVTSEHRAIGAGTTVLAAVAALPPERLGAASFRTDHGVRQAYMAGAMANGIASAELVTAMARAGFLASFGAGGLLPERIDAGLSVITRQAPGLAFACNLIHSPNEPALERATVDLCLRHQVRCLEASAFLDLTPQVVRFRVAGLSRGPDGAVRIGNRLIAKVSRPEVAERFLRPAPEALVRTLLESGDISAEQAELARLVPMADDITAEADSGGHTDRRPLSVLLPELIALRDRIGRESPPGIGPLKEVRVGAGGGIGTPAAACAAFAMGAAYVVTGSINQASVEATQSEETKLMLAAAGTADCGMAPSADMFEMGVDVQVLRRGTMFASRARRLYEIYRDHPGIEAIPAADREELERRIFQRPLTDVWADTVQFFTARDPAQIERASQDPKRRMALIFRWYLGLSSGWSIRGDLARVTDYQVWCGPSMGSFNEWVAGTYLAPLGNRQVAGIARNMMTGAAFSARVSQLAFSGVSLPPDCRTYLPVPGPQDR
jgi:trans-AT polyketide synthase/acyltransferase/oxidoreductase domain-containing protein